MKAQLNSRGPSSYQRVLFIALVVFGLTMLITGISMLNAAPVSAMPAAKPPSPSAQLWDCSNGSTGTGTCIGIQSASGPGWNKGGNLSTADYFEGDTVPFRIELDEMDPNATYAMTISYGFVVNHAYTWDYPRTWNATVIVNGGGGGNPCDGLPAPLGGTNCSPTFTFPIPTDPKFDPPTSKNCPTVPPGNSAFTQTPGNLLAIGPVAITAWTWINTPSCLTTSADNDQAVRINFSTGAANNTGTTPNSVNAVLVYGLHTSKPGDWCLPPAPACTASTLGGGQSSAYHAQLGCANGACNSDVWDEITGPNPGNPGGAQTAQLQMKIGAAPTAVTLSKFGVIQVIPSHATISWATGSEVNTAGFNLYRSENPNGPFVRINPQLIPASRDSLAGAKYEYQDDTVTPGKTYYYQLEDVEYNGTSTRHTPSSVTIPPEFSAVNARMPIVFAITLGAFVLIGSGLYITLKKFNVL